LVIVLPLMMSNDTDDVDHVLLTAICDRQAGQVGLVERPDSSKYLVRRMSEQRTSQ
jgi:hypothetical protein